MSLRKKPFRLESFIPREQDEQAHVMEWARLNESRLPDLELLFASMNGILTSPQFGATLKRLGRKAGVPDLFLPVARGSWWGCFIELKRREHGTLSPPQEAWIGRLRTEGYRAEVARGAKEAIAIIEDYLKLPRTVCVPFLTHLED